MRGNHAEFSPLVQVSDTTWMRFSPIISVDYERNTVKRWDSSDIKFGFGRLIDLARAKTVAVTKHGRPVVVVLSVEGYERLKPLDTPETPPASEEQG